MKKILFLLAMLPMFIITACSSNSDDIGKENIENGIIGVWETDGIIVSFDGKGYYSAILSETFLDCGFYSVVDNRILCSNPYLNKKTEYDVSLLNNGILNMSAKYNDFSGYDNEVSLKLTKTNKTPASKENALVGKKYYFMLRSYGLCFVQFNTYNTARMQTDELKPKIQAWNYFYIEPYIYSQKYKDDINGLSLFYQECGKGEICKQKIEIGENGEIIDMDVLDI